MFKITLFIVLSLCTTLSFSKESILYINNMTNLNLHYLYVSPSSEKKWEDDLLGEDQMLAPNGQVSLTLANYDLPYFDIRAIDQNGNFYYRYKVSPQIHEVIFSPEDLVRNTSPSKLMNSIK